MEVFISYSTPDLDIVRGLAAALEPRANEKFWAGSNVPGEDAWNTIHGWIDSADLVLVVITDDTIARAFAVGQEVGRAKAKGKTVIPLVAEGIVAAELGCLCGVTYISISDDPHEMMHHIEAALDTKERKLVRDKWNLGIALAVCFLLAYYAEEEED